MPNSKYAFVSAYLKGAEAKVLTMEHVDRMSRISNIQDAVSSIHEVLDIIRDTDAGRYLDEAMIKSFDESDDYLWRYLGSSLEKLEQMKLVPADMRKVLQAYMVKYDVANIKAALSGLRTGRKPKLIPVGIIHNRSLLDELMAAEDINGVIGVLLSCRLGDYADIIRDYNPDDKKSRFLTESRLDGKYYENLLKVTKKVPDGALMSKAFSIIIDMTNLSLINRAVIEEIGSGADEFIISGGYMISDSVAKELIGLKLAEMPGALGAGHYREIAEEIAASYGRTKSVSVIEEIIDKHRFQILRDMLSPRVLTPAVIAWYLVVKEAEIRNLRLILKVTFDGISVEEIKEYLVSA